MRTALARGNSAPARHDAANGFMGGDWASNATTPRAREPIHYEPSEGCSVKGHPGMCQ